jgi:hypothetical protein
MKMLHFEERPEPGHLFCNRDSSPQHERHAGKVLLVNLPRKCRASAKSPQTGRIWPRGPKIALFAKERKYDPGKESL